MIDPTNLDTRVSDPDSPDDVGRMSYIYAMNTALLAIQQARSLVQGDITETNHELPLIEQLITDALVVC